MWSPSARALDSDFRTTAPTPSPGTYPSPPAPKLRHSPSVDAKPPRLSSTILSVCTVRLTPPATTTSLSPRRIDSQPRCTVVSDEEHIVSTAMLGPCASRKYDTRLAIDANDEPTGCRDGS